MPEVPRHQMAAAPVSSRVQRPARPAPCRPSCGRRRGSSAGPGFGEHRLRTGLAAGTTGSTSLVPAAPSRTVAVAGYGVGQIIGHIALDSASRILVSAREHPGCARAAPAGSPRRGAPPQAAGRPGPAASPAPVGPAAAGHQRDRAVRRHVAQPGEPVQRLGVALPWISTRRNAKDLRVRSSGAVSKIRLHASAPRWSTVSSPHQCPASTPGRRHVPQQHSCRRRPGGSADSLPSGPQYSARYRSGPAAARPRSASGRAARSGLGPAGASACT